MSVWKNRVTAEQFKTTVFDPIKTTLRNSTHAVKQQKHFGCWPAFNALTKVGSYAGRVNKLLLEILETNQTQRSRTVSNGFKNNGKRLCFFFRKQQTNSDHCIRLLKADVSIKETKSLL
jgi:hypothetical protein